jgi:UDP-3-O-[3-hydroxymyristoyl] glucosamine N-acyltransferase
MKYTAHQVSEIIKGNIEGDPGITITSFGKIEEAIEGQLTFLGNPKYEEYLYTTRASLILLQDKYEVKNPISATIIRVADPYAAFVTLLTVYKKLTESNLSGIQQPAYISSTATVGENVFIGAFVYLGEHVSVGDNTKIYPNTFIGDNVQIGTDCILHAGVKIQADCILKNNIIIHSGTVIGSDGFGYAPEPTGTVKKIPQIGNVLIEDNVEIGANTAIDRATMGSTIIKKGAKIDNLIQIAHNVEIGSNTLIAAQAGISGSTKIGNNVVIAGQAGFADHIYVADGVKIGGQAGVTHSVKTPGTSVNDTPAFSYMQALRSQSIYRNLPELEKRIAALEKNIVPDGKQ